MKNIKKYFGLTLVAMLFATVFTGCKDDDEVGSANVGLGIKVFSPTKVVTGQPVTINGSGFGAVTEVVFPGDIKVTDFELVSNEMIRVITPAGIDIPEGGEKLVVRTENSKAESPLMMTQGNTIPRTYSQEEGADVGTKSILKIFGQDMEFINKVTFVDKNDQPLVILAKDFYRIATNSISIKIPANIKEGHQIGTFETMDGKYFEMPDFNFVAAAGHWEITRKYIWINEDNIELGAWSGTFRFALEGTENPEKPEEVLHSVSAEEWEYIKEGEVFFLFDGSESSNVRITTGWWTGAYGYDPDIDEKAGEHNSINFAEDDEESGKKVIKLNIKEDGQLYDNIDVQHLLFTGQDYTPYALYYEEKTWIEEAAGHWERRSLWKNEDLTPVPAWGGTFRFALAGTENPEKPEEVLHSFSADDWNLIKEGKVYVALDCTDASNIRITTGWWTGAYGYNPDIDEKVGEHNSLDAVQTDADGNKFIELNIKEDGQLYDNIDVQHLLFTGQDYTVLEIYVNEWVEEGAAKPVVIWENTDNIELGAWGGTFRFALEGTENPEKPEEVLHSISAEDWQYIKEGEVYFLFEGSASSNVRITTGWWTGAYGYDPDIDAKAGEHNSIDVAEDDAETGLKVIKLNIKEDGQLYDNIDVQHLLFTGQDYTPKKLYYIKK